MNRRFETAISIFMCVVTVGFAWYIVDKAYIHPSSVRVHAPLPKDPIALDEAVTRGLPSAKIALIEYANFQCPFCARYAKETWPTIEERYIRTGKVLAVYRHYVGHSTDALAWSSAAAAACAGEQGKFWEMHDALFRRYETQTGQDGADGGSQIRQLSRDLGITPSTFERCLTGTGRRAVLIDVGSGVSLGVQISPTLFIGTIQPDGRVRLSKRIEGTVPAQELAAILDALLTAAAAGS